MINLPQVNFTLIGFWLITAITTFGLMAFNGVVLFKHIFRKRQMNLLVLLGGGMVVGPLIFLALINFFGYLFKGPLFLTLLFFGCTTISIYKMRLSLLDFMGGIKKIISEVRSDGKYIYLLLGLNIILFYVFVGRANVGGDVLQYWAIATSFARGNFPTMMPYQPDFLTVYHTGTYLVLGLLHVISGFDIDRVHFFFSFYLFVSIFLLTTGLAIKNSRGLISLLPSVFGLVVFGAPIFLTEFNYQKFGLSFVRSIASNFFDFMTKYPTFDMNIGSIGGGAISTESMIYLIQILFSLAVFFLFIYILTERDRDKPLKDYILLVVITNLNHSINEVFLPMQLFLIGIFFIYDYHKRLNKATFIHGLTLLIIFGCLFFIIQNSTRDSLLTPSPEAPRFHISIPPFESLEKFTNPLRPGTQFRQDIVISTDGKGDSWHLVDIRVLIILGILLSLLTRKTIPLALSLSALVGLLCEIFIYYTFSPWANFRFFSQNYQLMSFAFGFILVDLFSRKQMRILVLIILFIMSPQVVSSYFKIINTSLSNKNQNYTAHNPENTKIKTISKLISSQSRVLIVSFMTDGNIFHNISSDALIRYGLTVPLGPVDTKILNIATGIEWYDAVMYLDPKSLKELRVDYVFLDKGSTIYLPKERVEQLYDSQYFKSVIQFEGNELLSVSDSFKKLENGNYPTLQKMVSKIEPNRKVYLDKVNGDIRRLLFLSLYKKRSELFGEGYLHLFGGEYYMAVEIPFVKITEDTSKIYNIDYAIMRPGINPSDFIFGKYQKVAESKFAHLWERVNLTDSMIK